MTQNQESHKQPPGLPGQDTRSNGLLPEAPNRARRSSSPAAPATSARVLVPRLLDRGYKVRVLDRLYWGEQPLADVIDRIELVLADVRDMPATALDGVDAVINLSGLSNDPTAEYDPEANWQMNAVATETLGQACVERGIERFVFASSCSLYDGLPPGMHDETAPIEPRGAYATSKRYGEEKLLELVDDGPLPGDPAQRHRLRLQPADALRPGRQHLRQGRAAQRQALPPRRRLDVAAAGRRPATARTR